MDDLVTFLRACLDDDERVAREAHAGPWRIEVYGDTPDELEEQVTIALRSVGDPDARIRWRRDGAH